MKKLSPCLDCPNRTSNCHCKCKQYAEWKEKLCQRNDTIRKSKQMDSAIVGISLYQWREKNKYRKDIR